MTNKNIHTMKQPELGKRISELRKEKGLTQEELVEQCNINVRTIQRIEAGEVNPRSYTIKIIFDVLGEEFKQVETNLKEEQVKRNWTETEIKTLNNSWISGIFYALVTLIGVLMEVHFATNNSSNLLMFLFRVPFAIVFFILIIPFLKGYKLLAKKFNNSLLNYAVYIYFFIALIMSIIMIFSNNTGLLSTIQILISVFFMLIFGAGELILGLGILKLKQNLDSLAQIVGILKIINGVLLITVILSPIALVILIPILILEIVFLYNTFKTAQNSQTEFNQ